MFLGTSRIWWILSGVLFILGLVLMGTASGSPWQMVLGLLLLFSAIGTFAAAPMRYGENARLTRKERRAEGGGGACCRQCACSGYADRQPAPGAAAAAA